MILSRAIHRPSLAAAALGAALACAGCGSAEIGGTRYPPQPKSDARIVVLPVMLPASLKLPAQDQRTLAALCATEMLRSYEVLELERFELMLEERRLTLEDVLDEGTGKVVAEEMGVDALLVSEVYAWKPGKAGLLFLASSGTIGYQGRLVDLASGSLLWSTNRVGSTEPNEPLSIAASRLFGGLVEDMTHESTASKPN